MANLILLFPWRSSLYRSASSLLGLFLLLALGRPVSAQGALELRDGDRVVLLGSELVEQQARYNYLEAALSARWPERRIVFRNMGWSGDTPTAASRGYFGGEREGYRRLQDELDRTNPTVVFLYYGSNAAFDGPGRIAAFLQDLDRLIGDVRKHTDRIVIVSPPPAEKLAAPLPDPSVINAQRRAVAAALSGFAKDRGLRYVDLFGPMEQAIAAAPSPLTHDTIRFNAAGYRALAAATLEQLGIEATGGLGTGEKATRLRQLIAEKNELYFHRYRPQNETYLRGFRKHEQGQNAKEIAEFDALIAQAEARIAALLNDKPLPRAVAEPAPHELEFEALDPEEQRRQFTLAPELEISLFAAEPMVANPIHMNFDSRGRLWVATSPIYPHIKPGAKAKDEVVILEDTDGDGRADRKTIFADDLLIPTAVLPDECGGAYVANSTELLHLGDTDGDGRADTRRVVLSGFGTEDTHHILHTFRWGPDAAFYFNQSIYIHTHLETPYGVRRLMGSGIWRFRPETVRAEVMMRGLVNPWGHIFDRWGQSFATDGAGGDGINYVFPGAAYSTAVGYRRVLRGMNPGQPKHCGLEIVTGRHFPDDWQGTLVTNDFRGNRINRFRLSEQGSGYESRQLADVVSCKDRAFRPVDIKLGPDGALYVADWHNPIINHGEVDFRDPRRDYKHGRIWRITAKDRPLVPRPNLVEASADELVAMLDAPEQWTRRMAKVQLTLRDHDEAIAAIERWVGGLDSNEEQFEHRRLEALWAYQAIRHVEPKLLKEVLASPDHRARAAALRVLCEWRQHIDGTTGILERAIADEHPRVRLEAISALRELGTAESVDIALRALEREVDQYLDFDLWVTLTQLESKWLDPLLEGKLAFADDAKKMVFALQAVANPRGLPPLIELLESGRIEKSRRADVIAMIGKFGQPEHLKVAFERALSDPTDRPAALAALVEAAASRDARPEGDLSRIEQVLDDPQGLHLAGLWQIESLRPELVEIAEATDSADARRWGAIVGLAALGDEATLARLAADDFPLATRRMAVVAALPVAPEATAEAAAQLLAQTPAEHDVEAVAVIDGFLGRQNGPELLAAALKEHSLEQRVATAALRRAGTAGRRGQPLVKALRGAGRLGTVEQKLSPEQLSELIKQVEAEGDAARGEAIYRRAKLQCITCHSIAGGGGKVGPDLVSLGASSPLDYIIQSMLDPSAKIKEGYHTTNIVTAQGKVFTGTLISEGDGELVLRDATNKEHVIQAGDVDEKETSPTSIMPTELTVKMRRDEFVDLVAFLGALGKEGSFKAPANRYVRRWIGADGAVHVSQVDGCLPAAEIIDSGGVSFTIDVTTAGLIALELNDPDGLRITRGDREDNLRAKRIVVDLPTGRHRFTVEALRHREVPLNVQLIDLPNSLGRAQPVNQ